MHGTLVMSQKNQSNPQKYTCSINANSVRLMDIQSDTQQSTTNYYTKQGSINSV